MYAKVTAIVTEDTKAACKRCAVHSSCSSLSSFASQGTYICVLLWCDSFQRNNCRQQTTLCFIGSLRHSSTARIKSCILRDTFLFHTLGKASGYQGYMGRCVIALNMKDFLEWLSVYFIFPCSDFHLSYPENLFSPRYSQVQGSLGITLTQHLLPALCSLYTVLPITAEHNGQMLLILIMFKMYFPITWVYNIF